METSIIPLHLEGKQNDLHASKTCADTGAAARYFALVKKRLQDPSCWHHLAGPLSGEFETADTDGTPADRPLQQGDLLRIDLPGPGPAAGEGYDWVEVEAIEDRTDPEASEELYAIRLRPAMHPGSAQQATAHFFTEEASSSFVLERAGTTITISYHGRNEKINTEGLSTMDAIRNSVIGSSALAGVSEMQWQSLLKGLLSEPENNENSHGLKTDK